jgi:hypothetical protein
MLTAEEKAAAREFLSHVKRELDDLQRDDPPTYVVPNFLAVYRHLCPGRDGRSSALETKEIYRLSPIYPERGVPAGRFGFIYRQGRCRGCGHTARSGAGWLVDALVRPPITGHVARS